MKLKIEIFIFLDFRNCEASHFQESNIKNNNNVDSSKLNAPNCY